MVNNNNDRVLSGQCCPLPRSGPREPRPPRQAFSCGYRDGCNRRHPPPVAYRQKLGGILEKDMVPAGGEGGNLPRVFRPELVAAAVVRRGL